MRWSLLLVFSCAILAGETGLVVDPSGAAVPGARIRARAPSGALLASTTTGALGRFEISGLQRGAYLLEVEAPGFDVDQSLLRIPVAGEIRIQLAVSGARGSVSVTASRGSVEETESAAAVSAVVARDRFLDRPVNTIGNLLENQPGVLVQQTTPGQVSPFLRGLTGYQVLNLIDGVRFNNSTFRSGPNQYLAFLEPSQADRVEAMLGPASSQYGSDSLGGAIHVRTLDPREGPLHADLQLFGASADLSAGSNAVFSGGTPRFGWLLGGAARRVNDLRAGGGTDSRNVFRGFFGLSASQIRELTGDRAQDSAFTQSGAHSKILLRPTERDSFSAFYQFSSVDGVRNYKDLLGGLGRLRSDVSPQRLHFLYGRYERFSLGWLDSLSGTFSWNAQADGSVRQGLRFTDPVTEDSSRVDSYGLAVHASEAAGRRHLLSFGGEWFRELIASRRTLIRDAAPAPRRPLYPDGSRYQTWALFLQDSMEYFGGKVRAAAGGRLTGIRFTNPADAALGVARSAQNFGDATFHASLSFRLAGPVTLHGLVSRGFRAPNANDLGAVGLNDLGYEIPAADALSAGALLGASAAEGALSLGRPIQRLKAERLFNYEAGLSLRARRFYARAQVFTSELFDPIVRRTLLFPSGSLPAELGGIPVTPIPPTPAQAAQGVSPVATPLDPRAVKAFVNDGRSRYYGVESQLRWEPAAHWFVDAGYSFLAGRELNPNRNIRRLPPQQGTVGIRYAPARRWWVETLATLTGAQNRLSGGDFDDERIGASRGRNDIAAFFNGARAQAFVAGGVFLPTGETLAQIQNRVLPGVSNAGLRVPLYFSTAGWASFDLRGGYRIGERITLTAALMNLLDRNYRVHGSGFDSAGINAFAAVRYRF
ncbi:MAG: TonB-dependent receptor [Bryobacteraceae bacterium]|nr:TonB-dependent receptor [Bryobacteraceae bacterium]